MQKEEIIKKKKISEQFNRTHTYRCIIDEFLSNRIRINIVVSYYSYPGLDLNSARRKNATRETTSALKAWLYEHRKNPYPTKGEKIMLAIITRMTLTQVSTWFANARRRLKKETKLDDKDGDMVDLDDIDVDGKCSEISRFFYGTDKHIFRY